jgi:pimeloyl-ACP methyl ester carboxylesterase
MVRVHDTGLTVPATTLTIVWHHGSPQTGALLTPLLAAAADRGIRLVSYGRPSYGGSTPLPGRDVASAAGDVAQVADALNIERFATMGASGGGPHALACAALLPGRVAGVACLAGIAPFTTGFDWFTGMHSAAALRAAAVGRATRADLAETDEFDPAMFTAADWSALQGQWAELGQDAERASADGVDGLIDDDVAFATPWGFDLADITAPVLLVQGGQDRIVPPSHARWMAEQLPQAELRVHPDSGHVSILEASPEAMHWLLTHTQ